MIWDVETEDFRDSLINSIEARDALQAKFTDIWMKDYLSSLRETHKNSQVSPKVHPFLKVGSIVVLKNPFKTRIYWTLVRIIEIMPSNDGQIRAVKIMRPDGSTTKSAVNNLYPLELEAISVPPRPSLDDPPMRDDSADAETELSTEELNDIGSIPDEEIDEAQNDMGNSSRNSAVQSSPLKEKNSGPSLRPRRKAAVKCNDKNKEIFNAEDM